MLQDRHDLEPFIFTLCNGQSIQKSCLQYYWKTQKERKIKRILSFKTVNEHKIWKIKKIK